MNELTATFETGRAWGERFPRAAFFVYGAMAFGIGVIVGWFLR